MKITTKVLVISAFAVAVAAPTSSALAAEEHKIIPAQEIAWGKGPPSLPPGAQAVPLYGNPGKEGLFAYRIKLPAAYHIPPHTHPKPEVVTVLSGTVLVGMGKTADKAKTQSLPAGSLFAFEPGMAHYVYADEETVLQLNSVGPWDLSYVNPEDDPRKKKTN